MAQKVAGLVVALVILAGLIGVPTWVAAQSPLEGVWEVQETLPDGADNGLMVIHGQHYALAIGPSDRPNLGAEAQTATADQLRAAWGPFFGHAGTFELTGGDTLTLRPSVAKDSVQPAGRFAEFRCVLEDDDNTLLLTVVGNQNGAIENGVTVRYRRVE